MHPHSIMWLVIEKQRLDVRCWMHANTIEAKARSLTVWPPKNAWVEWCTGPDTHRLELFSDAEVGLVCRMLSCIHEMDSDTAAIEAKVAAHMLAPDSDPEDEVKSDEDLTYEDLEAVGMRHVFYYE